jgi:hypothetical protein
MVLYRGMKKLFFLITGLMAFLGAIVCTIVPLVTDYSFNTDITIYFGVKYVLLVIAAMCLMRWFWLCCSRRERREIENAGIEFIRSRIR